MIHTAYPFAGNACILEAIRSGSDTSVDEDFGSLDEDFGILRMMRQTPSEHHGSKISCLRSACNTELEASHNRCCCNSAYCFSFLPPLHFLRSDTEMWMEDAKLLHVMPVMTPSLYGIWHLDGSPETPPEAFTWIWEIFLPHSRRRTHHLAHRLRRCVGGGEAPGILAAKGEK